VDRDHVLVNNRRSRPALAGKSLARCAHMRKMGSEHFNGNRAIQFTVMRFEHDAHSAAADNLLNVIPTEAPQHLWMTWRTKHLQNVRVHRLPLIRGVAY